VENLKRSFSYPEVLGPSEQYAWDQNLDTSDFFLNLKPNKAFANNVLLSFSHIHVLSLKHKLYPSLCNLLLSHSRSPIFLSNLKLSLAFSLFKCLLFLCQTATYFRFSLSFSFPLSSLPLSFLFFSLSFLSSVFPFLSVLFSLPLSLLLHSHFEFKAGSWHQDSIGIFMTLSASEQNLQLRLSRAGTGPGSGSMSWAYS